MIVSEFPESDGKARSCPGLDLMDQRQLRLLVPRRLQLTICAEDSFALALMQHPAPTLAAALSASTITATLATTMHATAVAATDLAATTALAAALIATAAAATNRLH